MSVYMTFALLLGGSTINTSLLLQAHAEVPRFRFERKYATLHLYHHSQKTVDRKTSIFIFYFQIVINACKTENEIGRYVIL